MAEPGKRRRTFGPVVLLGLASAGLVAIAGDRAAAHVTSTNDDGATGTAISLARYDAHQPLVTALGLVVLACWGVVLVTRGRVRRGVALLGVVASAGALVAAVVGLVKEPGRLKDAIAALGGGVDTFPTVWAFLAVLGALLSVGACVLAVRLAPSWPEMGTKYDAPGAQPAAPVIDPEEQTSLDLWKAMDEGRDPTA
ncbi:Trp biosynthesis-associated membrane protein [Nocardioides sp. CN2-186]|uniref:Trp biosynthesis-associated membrane protein n=1 Tax=Nocardioides tweenelious TaxID=3156607 RepID=UPI0032B32F2E